MFDELVGVYITADWLRAAGFLQQEDGTYKRDGFPFHIIQHEYVVVLFEEREIAGMRFVHELQHFYAGIKQRQLVIQQAPGS